jgi:hypothetical protein
MTDLKKAAQQALASLRGYRREMGCEQPCDAERALDAALEQPEQEPVAWACFKNGQLQTELVGTEADVDFWCASDEPEMQGMVKGALYTAPPQRKPLSDEELDRLWREPMSADWEHREYARAVEAAHGIKEEK